MSKKNDSNLFVPDDDGGMPSGFDRTLTSLLSGGVAGATEIAIFYPFEYIKTQLQLDTKGEQRKYSGAIDCLRSTVRKRGFFGLYRGCSVLAIGAIPKTSIRFASFEYARHKLKRLTKKRKLSPYQNFCCGLVAGVCEAIFAVVPMETVKVKMINDQRSDKPRFKGVFSCIKQIIVYEGLSGIYQGVTPTVLKCSINQAVRFCVFESLRNWYTDGDKKTNVPKGLLCIFASVSGFSAVFINAPFDIVKTRLQGLDAKKYNGMIDCFKKILHNEGFLAFYRGTAPRLFRAGSSLTLLIYEGLMGLTTNL